jgi:predicted phage-related endonuclease
LRLVDPRRLDRWQWLDVRRRGIGSSDAAVAMASIESG